MILRHVLKCLTLTEVVLLGNPKLGMYYEDGRKKAIRFAKRKNTAVTESIVNQVRLHEGEKGFLGSDHNPDKECRAMI